MAQAPDRTGKLIALPVELAARAAILAAGLGGFAVVAADTRSESHLASAASGFGLVVGLVLGLGSWSWIRAWRSRLGGRREERTWRA